MKKIDTEDFIKLLKSNTNNQVKKTISNIISIKKNRFNNIHVEIEGVEYEKKTINEIKKNIFYKAMPGVLDSLLKEYYVDINFIKKHIAFINFNTIVESQILTEEFLMDFVDEIDWKKAIIHQDLSDDFINKIFKKIKVVKKEESVTWNYASGTTTIINILGNGIDGTNITTLGTGIHNLGTTTTNANTGIVTTASYSDVYGDTGSLEEVDILDDTDLGIYNGPNFGDDVIVRTIDGIGNRGHF